MANSTMYQFRIDPKEKAETFKVLEGMGIKPAQAVRLFFRHLRTKKALPFEIEHVPNEETSAALLASDEAKGYKSFSSVDALFADLKK